MSGAAWALLGLPLLACERQMMRTGGPGIIPFELAGDEIRAREIMRRWGRPGQAAARRSLLLDYPYLLSYSCLLAFACEATAESLHRRGHFWLAAAGAPLAWGQLAGGACDAAENAALLAVLAGARRRMPVVARVFAVNKFILLGLGLGYCLLGFVLSRRGS